MKHRPKTGTFVQFSDGNFGIVVDNPKYPDPIFLYFRRILIDGTLSEKTFRFNSDDWQTVSFSYVIQEIEKSLKEDILDIRQEIKERKEDIKERKEELKNLPDELKNSFIKIKMNSEMTPDEYEELIHMESNLKKRKSKK